MERFWIGSEDLKFKYNNSKNFLLLKNGLIETMYLRFLMKV